MCAQCPRYDLGECSYINQAVILEEEGMEPLEDFGQQEESDNLEDQGDVEEQDDEQDDLQDLEEEAEDEQNLDDLEDLHDLGEQEVQFEEVLENIEVPQDDVPQGVLQKKEDMENQDDQEDSDDDSDDEEVHSLLEPEQLKYSDMTLRRAFLVWNTCGQTNAYKDVCKFYHYLEAIEADLSPEERKASQDLELRLATESPPISETLLEYFPKLYPIDWSKGKPEVIKNNDITMEIINTSIQLKKYCLKQKKSLSRVLREFYSYTEKCNLEKNVVSMNIFLNKKLLAEEMALNEKIAFMKYLNLN